MASPNSGTLPTGYRRQHHSSLASTNAEAFARARAGEAGGLWVTAGEQSAGKGRRGRSWTTGAGNLAASLLLIDPAAASVAATISFVASVALHQAVVDLTGPAVAERLSLKWPNDLLLDRHKVAGILVEGEKVPGDRFAVVVGVGVNCTSHPEVTGALPASDFNARGAPLEAEALFVRVAERMAGEILRWDGGNGFAAIRVAWLKRSGGVGDPIRVNLPDRTIDGRFEDIDRDGRLVLVKGDGVRETFSAGDVFFAVAD